MSNNMIDFSNNIPLDSAVAVFNNFFDQHIAVYEMLKGIQFIDAKVLTDGKSSIMYALSLGDNEDKNRLVDHMNGMSFDVYNRTFIPEVHVDGNLLCITLNR